MTEENKSKENSKPVSDYDGRISEQGSRNIDGYGETQVRRQLSVESQGDHTSVVSPADVNKQRSGFFMPGLGLGH